jgi:hypothetical protein
MANFSSFFPVAAAGGGIGQTITVGDYSYPNAISVEDFSETKVRIVSSYQYSQNYHFLRTPSSSSPTSFSATPSSNNTYVTLANITSATNGGGIYFLGGEYNNVTNYCPQLFWRITIDGGTPYEIGSAYICGPSQLWMMGSAYEMVQPFGSGDKRYSGTQTIWGNSPSDGVSIAKSWSTNSYSDGEYYASSADQQTRTRVGVYPAEHAATMGCPYIYFSSSCLVEFKVIEASSFGDGDGFATIKTF